MIDQILSTKIGDVELWRIIALFGSILIIYTVGKIGMLFLLRMVPRLENKERIIFALFVKSIARSLSFVALVIGLTFGVQFLNLSPDIQGILNTIISMLMVLAVAVMAYRFTEIPAVWFERHAQKSDNKLASMLVPIIRTTLRITVVVLAFVQIAQVLSDQPITSIIAGLGVGGLALALAAQDSIRNFFGSVVIIADKPFQNGERVVVDGFDGIVEQVGIRSTKIRTLEGHLVTIPNGELANKNIQNIGRRPYIRRLFNITITYDTPPEKIDRALEIVKGLLENHEGMNEDFPPRVYFNEFNSDSLNLLVIYWYHPPEFWDFLAFGERLNKEIFRRFNEEGIDFAFPTQTIHLAGDKKRPVDVGVRSRPGPGPFQPDDQ